jgi:hypothetical protein
VDGSAPHQGLRSSCHQAHLGSRRAPPRFGGVLAVGGELHPCTSSGGLDRLCGGISHHDRRRAGSDGRAHSSTLTCASLHADTSTSRYARNAPLYASGVGSGSE